MSSEGFESELDLIPALVKRAKLQGINSIDQLADRLGFSSFDTEMALAEDTLTLALDLSIIQWLQVRLLLGFSHREVIQMLTEEEHRIRTTGGIWRTAYDTAISPKKPRKRRKATNPKSPSSPASSSASQPYIYLLPDSPRSGS